MVISYSLKIMHFISFYLEFHIRFMTHFCIYTFCRKTFWCIPSTSIKNLSSLPYQLFVCRLTVCSWIQGWSVNRKHGSFCGRSILVILTLTGPYISIVLPICNFIINMLWSFQLKKGITEDHTSYDNNGVVNLASSGKIWSMIYSFEILSSS